MAKRPAELMAIDHMPVAKQPRIEVLVDWLQLVPDCWRVIITGLPWYIRLIRVLLVCRTMRDYVFPMRDVVFTREDADKYVPDLLQAKCMDLFTGIRSLCLLPEHSYTWINKPTRNVNYEIMNWVWYTRQPLKQLTMAPTMIMSSQYPSIEELVVDVTLSGVTPFREFWACVPAVFPGLCALTFVHDQYRLPVDLLSSLSNLTSLTLHRNHFAVGINTVEGKHLTHLRRLSVTGTVPSSRHAPNQLIRALRCLELLEWLEVDSRSLPIRTISHRLPSLLYLRWRDLKNKRLYQMDRCSITDAKRIYVEPFYPPD